MAPGTADWNSSLAADAVVEGSVDTAAVGTEDSAGSDIAGQKAG